MPTPDTDATPALLHSLAHLEADVRRLRGELIAALDRQLAVEPAPSAADPQAEDSTASMDGVGLA